MEKIENIIKSELKKSGFYATKIKHVNCNVRFIDDRGHELLIPINFNLEKILDKEKK